MALNLDTSGEAVSRTTNVPDENSDATHLFWWKPTVDLTNKVVFYLGDDPTTDYLTYAAIYLSSGAVLCDVNLNGGTPASTNVGNTAVGKWNAAAYTRSGTTHNWYLNGVLVATATKDWSTSATVVDNIWLGNDGFPVDTSNIQFLGYREYDRALTLSELLDEWNSVNADATLNLIADCPLISDDNDDSGNGNDFTSVGSVTFVSGPTPVVFTNDTLATAVDIGSIPTSFIQVPIIGTTVKDVWFKYTAALGDSILGFFGFGLPSGYTPAGRVFLAGPTNYLNIFATNKPFQIPVNTGVTYYINFQTNTSTGAAALQFTNTRFAASAVPEGSLLVNDDTAGFPAAIVSHTTGDILNYIYPFPNGEAGDILLNGKFLIEDFDNGTIVFYDTDFSIIATISGLANSPRIRTCHGVQKFYVFLQTNPVTVRIVDDTGTLEGGTITLTGTTSVLAGAASNDQTILYHSTSLTGSALKRWDVPGNAALSDLVGPTSSPPYFIGDILVLADDTIVATYIQAVFNTVTVRRYDASGTLLNSYGPYSIIRPGGTLPRLAYAIDDPNSFWLWIHLPSPNVGISRFLNIKVSDGSVLQQTDVTEFETGVYQPTASLTPLDDFGISFSCPFFVLRAESVETTGTIVVQKVTEPAADPQVFDFETTNLTPSTFDLEDGEEEVFSGLAPGDGYGVTETEVEGWATEITVSNDSDPTNISVSAGETVTVVFTNRRVGSITIEKIVVNSETTLKFLFTLEGTNISTSTVQLANGETHTFENIPAGTGYTLSETQLAPGWEITNIFVSNGSTVENIEVEAGVETVIIVTNTFTPNASSGIYKIEKGKTDDTLWIDVEQNISFRRKIPDPTAKTTLLGD